MIAVITMTTNSYLLFTRVAFTALTNHIYYKFFVLIVIT